MQTVLHRANERGYAKHGWLTTHHSFSFANYYNPEMMGFGALRVLNDDTIAAGQGFGRHSHQDMEIITIPLSGALAHEDSLGNKAVIQTGEVQVMSAGLGVEHAEFNASRTEDVSLLQIWILTRHVGVAPRYAQKFFDQTVFKNKLSLVVGPEESEKDGALFIHQDAFLSLGCFDTDATIEYGLQSWGNGVYFFVIDGEVAVADTVLGKRDALGVWDTEKVLLQAKSSAFILAIEVPMMELFEKGGILNL
ncbi:MAG: pirin family protein [Candidatus Moranbacteria bacterium]|nr:pirin family protein [Candidatus Moranbacteria bacterium]